MWVTIVTGWGRFCLQIGLYSFILYKAKTGSEYRFVYFTSVLLIVYSLCGLIYSLTTDYAPTNEATTLIRAYFSCSGNTLFMIAYWYYAQNYRRISIELPFVLDHQEIPVPSCCGPQTLNKGMITTIIAIKAL